MGGPSDPPPPTSARVKIGRLTYLTNIARIVSTCSKPTRGFLTQAVFQETPNARGARWWITGLGFHFAMSCHEVQQLSGSDRTGRISIWRDMGRHCGSDWRCWDPGTYRLFFTTYNQLRVFLIEDSGDRFMYQWGDWKSILHSHFPLCYCLKVCLYSTLCRNVTEQA